MTVNLTATGAGPGILDHFEPAPYHGRIGWWCAWCDSVWLPGLGDPQPTLGCLAMVAAEHHRDHHTAPGATRPGPAGPVAAVHAPAVLAVVAVVVALAVIAWAVVG